MSVRRIASLVCCSWEKSQVGPVGEGSRPVEFVTNVSMASTLTLLVLKYEQLYSPARLGRFVAEKCKPAAWAHKPSSRTEYNRSIFLLVESTLTLVDSQSTDGRLQRY